ncbi:MAG TPA: zf-HC2 domain-containing protein [Vicinamibacterales bacterium]|nr:zf-HC2 domain-containing protein [Vicinamibacterales bacterium]
MSDCRRIESLLTPYVDGEASPADVAMVDAHISQCPVCQDRVVSERVGRMLVRARAAHLAIAAPPGLRTRIVATLEPTPKRALRWRGRLSALAAAAAVVVLLVTAFEFVVPQSNVLFAAQLALDHVRCFVIELGSIDSANPQELQRAYSERYGWRVTVPPSSAEAGITLVSARRCPFWLGDHAHLLYRTGEHDVSLYITQGSERAPEDVAVLGHVERLWNARGDSYALIARGLPAGELERISDYFARATQ